VRGNAAPNEVGDNEIV